MKFQISFLMGVKKEHQSINQVTYIAPQIREKISIQGHFTSVILP
jgi:hypothetical protein